MEHSLTDGEEQHGSTKFLKKYLFYIFYDKAQVKKSINLPFLICVLFPFVLGHLLVKWFSLTRSLHVGPEDGRCSLMTYQGQKVTWYLYHLKFHLNLSKK